MGCFRFEHQDKEYHRLLLTTEQEVELCCLVMLGLAVRKSVLKVCKAIEPKHLQLERCY